MPHPAGGTPLFPGRGAILHFVFLRLLRFVRPILFPNPPLRPLNKTPAMP